MQKNLAFLIVKINKIWYNIQSKQYKNKASDMLTDTDHRRRFFNRLFSFTIFRENAQKRLEHWGFEHCHNQVEKT